MELSAVEPLAIYTKDSDRASAFLGSGFVIRSGWVATCEHVVRSAPPGHEIVVQHPQLDFAWRSKEVRCHPKHDIAFIRVAMTSNFMPLIEATPLPGQWVFSKGLHDELIRQGKSHAKMRLLRGNITSVMDDPDRLRTGRPYLELSYPILCGFSGSAVLVEMQGGGYGVYGMGFGNAEQHIVMEHEVQQESGTERKLLRIVEFGIAHSNATLLSAMKDMDI